MKIYIRGLLPVVGVITILAMALPEFVSAYDAGVNDLHGGTVTGGGTSGEEEDDDDGDDDDKEENDDEGKEGEPVSLFSGQFTYSKTDIDIPGLMPLSVSRVYRSDSKYQGMFGRGWNMEGNERLLLLGEDLFPTFS